MRVLVTGAAGFGASGLIRRLVQDGHEVVGVDVVAPEEAWRVRDLIDQGAFEYRWQAVQDMTPKSDHHFDAICHLAAVADVQAGHNSPRHTIIENTEQTLHLLECARSWYVERMILAGSAHSGDGDSEPRNEDSRVEPSTPYGCSKAVQELLWTTWRRYAHLPTIIMRNGMVAGRGMRRQIAPYLWCRRILTGLPVELEGGESTRDIVDARDTVSGWCKALTVPANNVIGKVLWLARGQETTVSDLLEECYQCCEVVSGVDIPRQVIDRPARTGDGHMRERFDTARTRAALGWFPSYSLRDTILDVAEWAMDELNNRVLV